MLFSFLLCIQPHFAFTYKEAKLNINQNKNTVQNLWAFITLSEMIFLLLTSLRYSAQVSLHLYSTSNDF